MSMLYSIPLLLLMATVLLPCYGTSTTDSLIPTPLKAASFNMRRFGRSKMSKPDVKRRLVQIISRYHLILVMEIVDKSGQAIQQLVDALSERTKQPFGLLLSPRLGRRVHEQYAFIYRTDMLNVVRSGVYPDSGDVFEREPFLVEFNSGERVRYLNKFTFIASHTKPDDAAVEIDALSDVLDFVRDGGLAELAGGTRQPTDSVMVLGDLNADCSYFTATESEENRLRQRSDVAWFPADSHDTTVFSTDCAYDRLIVYRGEEAVSGTTAPLMRAIVPHSVKAFRFDEELGLSKEEASAVSDHYPLEFELKPTLSSTTAISDGVKFHWAVFVSTSVIETTSFTETSSSCSDASTSSPSHCGWTPNQSPTDSVLQLAENAGFSMTTLFDSRHQPVQLKVSYNSYRLSAAAILKDLKRLQKRLPQLFSLRTLDVLEYKLPTLNDSTVFDPMPRARHTAEVVCEVTCGHDLLSQSGCIDKKSVCSVNIRKQTRVV